MPAPLSVVIPTLDVATALPAAAEALLPGLASGLIGELVVSDGGSTDATVEIAEALGARVVSGPRGRGGQISRGVAAAARPWLLILHADTRLGPGWDEAATRHIERAPEAAGYFRLRFRAGGAWPRIFEAGVALRSRAGLPYGDQGLLVSAELLRSVGGVPEIPLMEDVALARRLSGRLVPLDAEAATSAEKYVRDGWLRRGGANLVTLARYRLGASPERLARRYR